MSLKKTRFMQTVEFNQEILGIDPRPLGLQSTHEAALSFTQMREESLEFRDANEGRNFIEVVDSVLDELYFCYGILYKLGVTEEMANDMFTAIHNANMSKKKGVKKGREGYDAADAGKPEGWQDPHKVMEEIINAHLNNT